MKWWAARWRIPPVGERKFEDIDNLKKNIKQCEHCQKDFGVMGHGKRTCKVCFKVLHERKCSVKINQTRFCLECQYKEPPTLVDPNVPADSDLDEVDGKYPDGSPELPDSKPRGMGWIVDQFEDSASKLPDLDLEPSSSREQPNNKELQNSFLNAFKEINSSKLDFTELKELDKCDSPQVYLSAVNTFLDRNNFPGEDMRMFAAIVGRTSQGKDVISAQILHVPELAVSGQQGKTSRHVYYNVIHREPKSGETFVATCNGVTIYQGDSKVELRDRINQLYSDMPLKDASLSLIHI